MIKVAYLDTTSELDGAADLLQGHSCEDQFADGPGTEHVCQTARVWLLVEDASWFEEKVI